MAVPTFDQMFLRPVLELAARQDITRRRRRHSRCAIISTLPRNDMAASHSKRTRPAREEPRRVGDDLSSRKRSCSQRSHRGRIASNRRLD